MCRSGRVVNVKKGQFLAPWDVANIIGKFEAFGGKGLLLTERGSWTLWVASKTTGYP